MTMFKLSSTGIKLSLSAVMFAACVLGAGSASAQITSTKHNLSSTGTSTNKSDATEICVFCHTPHGSAATAGAPLWNKGAQVGTYTLYSSSTFDAAGTVSITAGTVSMACLSCHDGTQAMDNMINAPGSGNYNASGARPNSGSGYNWNTEVGSSGKLPSGITNLGTDLSNDHPVGMPYAQYTGGANADPDFKTASTSGSTFYVDTGALGTAGSKDKKDMILYTRADSKPYVECATCHDPHTSNATFLRIANTGSQLCLACHTK